MNWVPVVFIIFKIGVLGIGMFFSIKWHYDQAKSSRPLNVKKVILEAVLYLAAVIIVLGVVYSLFHYLHMLPVGTDFF